MASRRTTGLEAESIKKGWDLAWLQGGRISSQPVGKEVGEVLQVHTFDVFIQVLQTAQEQTTPRNSLLVACQSSLPA